MKRINLLGDREENGRGQPHSKTFGSPNGSAKSLRVLECGSPLPLLAWQVHRKVFYEAGLFKRVLRLYQIGDRIVTECYDRATDSDGRAIGLLPTRVTSQQQPMPDVRWIQMTANCTPRSEKWSFTRRARR